MTPKRLQELVARGETLDVEFKGEEARPLSDKELVETVVCMANRASGEAGWLFIGVEDDGRVTGARLKRDRNDPLRITAYISNQTQPSVTCRVEIVEIEGMPVIAIEIPPSRTPVGTTKGKFLRRAMGGKGEPVCLPLHFHEMQALQATRGVLDYTALPISEASWEDLDRLEFERLRRTIRESQGLGDASLLELSDKELASVLGAVEVNHEVTEVRVLGLLLFGQEEALRRYLPTHEVAFQVLSGTQVEVNEFFRWPLLRIMDEFSGRFRARNREQEIAVGMVRVGVPDYPGRAFREGLANALIHRDYTRLGAVHIQWHEEHIEFSSPGGFPQGVTLQNLLVAPPNPRNPLLAEAFKRVGLVERTGRGIDTIFYEQLRSGRAAPSYERSTLSNVVLTLPGGPPDLDFVRLLAEEGQAGRPLGLDALLLLNTLGRKGKSDVNEAARLIQKSEEDAQGVLGSLQEVGLIKAVGAGTKQSYHLSSATRERLGSGATPPTRIAHVPEKMEQRFLAYVDEHGSISRTEASTLGNITPPQAYRVLKKLVQKELIQPTDQRGRGVRYERKSR